MSESETVSDLIDALPRPDMAPLQIRGEIGALFGALAKAQGQIRGALKDSTNPHFKSKYADLESTWEACRKPLADNSLSIIQSPFAENGDVGVVSILGHSSGAYVIGRVAVKPMKFDAQGLGSVLTYLRRYALAAMVGVAPTDDDGEAAVGRSNGSVARPERGDPESLCISLEQEADLNKKIAESGIDRQRFLSEFLRVATLSQLAASDYVAAVKALEKRTKKSAA